LAYHIFTSVQVILVIMMFQSVALMIIYGATSAVAFQAPCGPRTASKPTSTTSLFGVMSKLKAIFYPQGNIDFDTRVKQTFPGAISNLELETKVVEILAEKGFTSDNTLLATSLCCDELARVLEDDLGRVYGKNFFLGGLVSQTTIEP
jgi:Limiting CO2-inducible proteins B/C beta carbonyic anhydrases